MPISQEKYNNFINALLGLTSLEKLNEEIGTFLELEPVKESGIMYDQVIQDFESRLIDYTRTKLNLKPDKEVSSLAKSLVDTWLKCFYPDKNSRNNFIQKCITPEVKPIVLSTKEIFDYAKLKNDEAYLVKGLLPSTGYFMLSAPPKVGKTNVVVDLFVNLAFGEKWLNRDVVKTNILYIQNDMGLIHSCKHLYKNKPIKKELEDPEKFQSAISNNSIILATGLDLVVDMDFIFRLSDDHNCGLIVIDALSSSLKKCGLDEYSKDLVPHLYRLCNFAHTTKKCVILLHHDTKAGMGDIDLKNTNQLKLMSSVAGLGAIQRSYDGIIKVIPDKQSDDVILNAFMARHFGAVSLTIRYEEKECNQWQWIVVKDSTFDDATLDTICDILELLYEQYDLWRSDIEELESGQPIPDVYGYSLDEICALMPDKDPAQLTKHINWMLPDRTDGIDFYLDSGKVIYCIKQSGESWLKQHLDIRKEQATKQKEYDEFLHSTVNDLRNIILNTEDTNIAERHSKIMEYILENFKDANNTLVDVLKKYRDKDYNSYIKYRIAKRNKVYEIGTPVKIIGLDDTIYEILEHDFDIFYNTGEGELKYRVDIDSDNCWFYHFQLEVHNVDSTIINKLENLLNAVTENDADNTIDIENIEEVDPELDSDDKSEE